MKYSTFLGKDLDDLSRTEAILAICFLLRELELRDQGAKRVRSVHAAGPLPAAPGFAIVEGSFPRRVLARLAALVRRPRPMRSFDASWQPHRRPHPR